jgi:hypothetical protein
MPSLEPKEKIMQRIIIISLCLSAATLASGCASYRTSSNIEGGSQTAAAAKKIPIFEGSADPGKKFRTTQKIEVSIKKLTLFHADPTKEQANNELEKRASALGCDAITNAQYQAGIGLTTWGYIDAQGNCAKFE